MAAVTFIDRELFVARMGELADQPIEKMQEYMAIVTQMMQLNQLHWSVLGMKLRRNFALISKKIADHASSEKEKQFALSLKTIATGPLNPVETWANFRDQMRAKAKRVEMVKALSAFETACCERGTGVDFGMRLLNGVNGAFHVQDYAKAKVFMDRAVPFVYTGSELDRTRDFSLCLAATYLAVDLCEIFDPPFDEEEIDLYRTRYFEHDQLSIARFFPILFRFGIDWVDLFKRKAALMERTSDQMMWRLFPTVLNPKSRYQPGPEAKNMFEYLHGSLFGALTVWLEKQEVIIDLRVGTIHAAQIKARTDEQLSHSQFCLEISLYLLKSFNLIFQHSGEAYESFHDKIEQRASLLAIIKAERNGRSAARMSALADDDAPEESATTEMQGPKKKKRVRRTKVAEQEEKQKAEPTGKDKTSKGST